MVIWAKNTDVTVRSMRVLTKSLAYAVCLAFAGATLSACGGGSKILKEPVTVELSQALAVARDQNLSVALDWVIVKDGPGTWAKNAWWDEYLISVANVSDEVVSLTNVQIIDHLETPLAADADYKQLVRASKQTAGRYDDYDIEVKPGAGTGALVLAGTGGVMVASAMAAASLGATIAGSATATTAAAGAGAVAIVLVAPALIVGGIIKGSNNRKVGREIEKRHTAFPVKLGAGESASIDVFFPLAPSPQSVLLVYETEADTRVIEIDTREVLEGLHLKPKESRDAAAE